MKRQIFGSRKSVNATPGPAKSGARIFDQAGAPHKIRNAQSGKGAARAAGWQGVTGPRIKIAHDSWRVVAEKNRARRCDARGKRLWRARHDLQVFRRQTARNLNQLASLPRPNKPAVFL